MLLRKVIEMALFKVNQPLRHDGKKYSSGDTIELKDQTLIDALMGGGTIEKLTRTVEVDSLEALNTDPLQMVEPSDVIDPPEDETKTTTRKK